MKKILTLFFIATSMCLSAQVVSEDFDLSDGGWTGSSVSGNNLWQHGTPIGTNINDDNGIGGSAWVTDLTGTFTLTGADQVFITSTAYNLSSLSTEGSVSVAINLDLIGSDWAYAEYSIDNGVNWTKLGTAGAGSNWYDDSLDEVWTTNSNTAGSWVTATQNLPGDALGATSVRFRFVFDTIEPAGAYAGEGFGIDDFQILNTNVGGGASLPNENFDLSDGGWVGSTISGANYWEWGAPIGTTINDDNGMGGNAWVTGINGDFTIINNSETMYLTSGAYDLSSLGLEGSVEFALNIDLASGDQAHVEYLINDGMSTWTKLGASGSGTNWYDDAVNDVWSVNSGGWIVAAHDLPPAVLGETSVSFRIVTVSSVTAGAYGAEGLAIDDFQINSANIGGGGSGSSPGTTQIVTMTLAGEIFPAVIDSTSNTVKLFVSPATDVTALAPTFNLSTGATVDLPSGSTQNFTAPVTYTVTSSDGMESTAWTISAVVPDLNMSVYPQSGLAGTIVTILGRGFSTTVSENILTLGSTTIPVLTATTNKLTFQVPNEATLGLNAISISVNGLTSRAGTSFNVLASGVSGTFADYREADFNLNASSYVNSMQVGDIDNDGDLDLVFDNETILNISTIENGRIQSTVNIVSDRNFGPDSFGDLTLIDVDEDGFLDVVAGGVRLGWYKNNGDGTWANEVIIDQTSSNYTIRVFDIDGDFDFDIMTYDDSNVFSFTNNGSGVFALNDKIVPGRLGPIVDWDEDGDMDILFVGLLNQNIMLARNYGEGDFSEEILVTRSATDLNNFQLGDLDNDGDLDFVIGTEDLGTSVSTLAYILNNGDGTFTSETSFITEGAFTTERLELADLNNDGFLDVIRTRNDGITRSSHAYYSSAALTYSSSEVLDSSTGTLDLVLVDIEGDGDMDILNEASQSGGYFPLFRKELTNADIITFSMPDQTGIASINSAAATISIEVNAAANITSLAAATMSLSPGASVLPDPSTVQDYSSPVVFTVTAEDGVTVRNWTVTVSQVPSVPVLSISNITQVSVDASWIISNGGGTNYELQLSTTNDFSSLVSGFDPLTISGSLSTSLINLVAGTTYYTRVRGANALGTFSDFSSTSTILLIPAAPIATLATNVVAESFTANWDASNGATSYMLEVSDNNFSSTVFTTTTTETTTVVNSGLVAGVTYEYRVTATNTSGTSEPSNEIQVTTNVPPSDLRMDSQTIDENADTGSLVGTFSITDPDDATHTYELVTGTGDTDNALFSVVGSNLVTNQIFNFEVRSSYTVRVQAIDSRGAASEGIQFNITINDVNDAPSAVTLETSCCGPRGFDIVGTKVADLFATDEDGDAIIFELVTGGDSFTVNNTTQSLNTAVVFDTEVDLVVPIQLRATDPDGANVTESFNVTIQAFVDTENPLISPSPQNGNTFLSGGPERTLSVTVEDFRLSEVKFFSRLLTESEFVSEVLTEVDGSYSRTVQEADLGVAGFEYYFEATDVAGNVGFSDLRTMALAFPESGENAPKVESVTKFGRTVDSYQIISIPFAFNDPSAKRVDAIFNEFSTDQINREYRIIKWDPTSGESGALVNLDQASSIELGEGYFFISAKERSITIESANINLQDPFPLVLRQGWNLVGNPYNIDIDWISVLTNNGALETVGTLRVLDPENPETWPESNILKTLEGAFVFANQDITLNMSYTDASISFGGGRMASGAPEADWFLPITLEQNGDFRNGGIGMDLEASSSLDVYDEPVLPKWLEYLEIAFLHEGEKFSRLNKDVIPLTDTKVWNFEVSSSSNGTSTLRWDENSSQVANLQLYNPKNGAIIDMTNQSSYQFELNGTASFKILYSVNPDATFDFEQLGVLEAYPNPFVESFSVPLRLPSNGFDYEVSVDIQDLSGRTIFQGAIEMSSGGVMKYDFNRPQGMKPGIYLYKVNINNALNSESYTKRIKVN